jgi:hypothetical protein
MQRKSWTFVQLFAGLIALGGLLTVTPVVRADEVKDDFEVPVPEERPMAKPTCPQCPECSKCPKGKVSFNVGIDVPTRYYFRGILQEDKGFIGQPYGELNINLWEYDYFRLTAIGGIWNSFHSMRTKQSFGSRARDAARSLNVSQRTLNPSFGDPEAWYEFDAYGGFAMGLGPVELSTIYTWYTSPSGAFEATQDIAVGASLDDSDWLGIFALNPGVTFYVETAGPGAFGSDLPGFDDGRGTLAQLHGGPEFDLTGGDNPITLGFPIEAGLSINDYYESTPLTLPASPTSYTNNSKAGLVDDATFGYFQAGVDLGVPLTFIPCEYGSWLLNMGGRFISMGRTLKEVNRNGDDYSFFGMFGLSMTY